MFITLPDKARIRSAIRRGMRAWASAEVRLTKSAFSVGGHHQHGGAVWLPRERAYPHPILLKTGALRRSVDWRAIADGVAMVADVVYAGFHQYGTRRGLPVRKVIDLTRRDLEDLRVQIARRVHRVTAPLRAGV